MPGTTAQPVDVLLVEDNLGDIRLTEEALRESSIATRFSSVRDGVAAMAFLRRTAPYCDAIRPDVILLDLNLPKKDGREVLEDIKNDPELRRIPVIVLTTSEAEQDVAMAYDLCASCYITKPVDFSQFVKVLKEIDRFWFTTARLPKK